MEKFAYTLEDMFQKMLLLYKELKEILIQETKHIVDMDVDSLWKITDGKNQLASEIDQLRVEIFSLLEENHIPLNQGQKNFGMSQIINSLPFQPGMKSGLKKIKIELDIVKEELTGLVSGNKHYITENLSVISGVFATITGSDTEPQYGKTGMVLKNQTGKSLIRAEV
jgi:FlgN protein